MGKLYKKTIQVSADEIFKRLESSMELQVPGKQPEVRAYGPVDLLFFLRNHLLPIQLETSLVKKRVFVASEASIQLDKDLQP